MIRKYLTGVLCLWLCKTSQFDSVVEGASIEHYGTQRIVRQLPAEKSTTTTEDSFGSDFHRDTLFEDTGVSHSSNFFDDDDDKPTFTNNQRQWNHPQQRNQKYLDPFADLTNHFVRKVNFLTKLPSQIFRQFHGESLGPDYRKFGSCQYRPCRSVGHAIDSFFKDGFFGF